MKKILAFLILIGFLFSCSQGENSTNGQKEDSNFYVQQEDSSNLVLLRRLSDSLKVHPNAINLWIKKGTICRENLNIRCALNCGAKAYSLDSTNLKARELYAWTLINKPNAPVEDIEKAQHHYKYILSEKPNNPKVLVDLANTYSLTGDFQTALKFINDALKINKEYRDAYVLKGSIYRLLEKYDLALSSYQTAIQLDPDFFMGQLHTGWLLTKMKEHRKALIYYRNAENLRPKNLNALYGIAKSYQDLGKYEKALAEYRKLAKVKPDFYITYFNEGYIKHYYQHELDSAKYFYDKAIKIEPKYIRAWYQLGEIFFSEEKYHQAAEKYSKALQIDPNYEPALEARDKLKKVFYPNS